MSNQTTETGRRLRRSVTITDGSGNIRQYQPGDVPDEDAASRITNPKAWEGWAPKGTSRVQRATTHWPPSGGLEEMSEDQVRAAAASNSVTTEGDEGEVRTQKETGNFSDRAALNEMTIPQLRAVAAEKEIDLEGANRKPEMIDRIIEGDSSFEEDDEED
jgi:hypothetical protein